GDLGGRYKSLQSSRGRCRCPAGIRRRRTQSSGSEDKAMTNRCRTFPSRCRAVLAWGLFFYVAFQLGLIVITDYWLPVLRDPEYGFKLARLRQRLAEEPDRELILVLGSSRAGYGFRPEVVPAWQAPAAEAPIIFNFALTGSGPILELLCLRRLLADGIQPNRVIIEVLP